MRGTPAKDEPGPANVKLMVRRPYARSGPAAYHWQDEQTLKIETDAGQQNSLAPFFGRCASHSGPRGREYSAAQWEDSAERQSPVVSD